MFSFWEKHLISECIWHQKDREKSSKNAVPLHASETLRKITFLIYISPTRSWSAESFNFKLQPLIEYHCSEKRYFAVCFCVYLETQTRNIIDSAPETDERICLLARSSRQMPPRVGRSLASLASLKFQPRDDERYVIRVIYRKLLRRDGFNFSALSARHPRPTNAAGKIARLITGRFASGQINIPRYPRPTVLFVERVQIR